MPAPVVEALDTSGAGDVFAGVLAAGWTIDREHALRRACAAGALATLVPGAGNCAPYSDAIDEASAAGLIRQARTTPDVVGDREAVAGVKLAGVLAHQDSTAVGRKQDRHVVMRRIPYESQPVHPNQSRPDRHVEQTGVARTGDLSGDLMLHPIDDNTCAGE